MNVTYLYHMAKEMTEITDMSYHQWGYVALTYNNFTQGVTTICVHQMSLKNVVGKITSHLSGANELNNHYLKLCWLAAIWQQRVRVYGIVYLMHYRSNCHEICRQFCFTLFRCHYTVHFCGFTGHNYTHRGCSTGTGVVVWLHRVRVK